MVARELDVRALRKPDKHPTIFAAYDGLEVGDAFVLINNHDPQPLHAEFELEHPAGYGWDYLESGPEIWRIRITRRASTSLPRVLCDTAAVGNAMDSGVTGAVWRLPMKMRDLDSNIIQLPANATIDAHAGPDIDVLVHVIEGDGWLATELDTLRLSQGVLAWLPRRSQRQITAGAAGLRYLTVHQRRKALVLAPSPHR